MVKPKRDTAFTILCQLLTQELYDNCPTNTRCFNLYYLTAVDNSNIFNKLIEKVPFVASDNSPVSGV